MNPKTQRILDREATLFKDGEHPIYLLSDGRFAVMWGGRWVAKPALKSVEKIIAKERKTLTVFRLDYPDQPVEAAEFHENKVIDKDGKRHHRSWRDWYVWDAKLAAKLVDLAQREEAAEKAFGKERDSILKQLRRVSTNNFEDILAGVPQEPDPEEEDE